MRDKAFHNYHGRLAQEGKTHINRGIIGWEISQTLLKIFSQLRRHNNKQICKKITAKNIKKISYFSVILNVYLFCTKTNVIRLFSRQITGFSFIQDRVKQENTALWPLGGADIVNSMLLLQVILPSQSSTPHLPGCSLSSSS